MFFSCEWVGQINLRYCNISTKESLYSKNVTQVWLAWWQAEPFWLIADWLSLLPSSAWLKFCFRAFSQTNPSLRSCLTAWPRCSLVGQLQPEISIFVGLAWWSLARLVELEYCPNRVLKSVTPKEDHILLTPPRPTVLLKSSNPILVIWVRFSRSPAIKQPNI